MTSSKQSAAMGSILRVLFLSVAIALSGAVAHAANGTWNQTTTGTYDWTTSGNWLGGVPNATGELANLAVNLTGSQTINLGQTITTGTLTLGDTGSTYFGVTIATGTLNMQVASGTAAITKATTANTATDTISSAITLGSDLVINNAAAGALALSGNVNGSSRSLTKSGTGTLNLNGTTTVGSLYAGYGGLGGSTILGNGASLSVGSGTASSFFVGVNVGAGTMSTLDVSSGNLTANVGNFYVGVSFNGGSTGYGTLKLGSATITSTNVVIGGADPEANAGAGSSGVVTTAANSTVTINTPFMAIGSTKAEGAPGNSFTLGAGSSLILGATNARTQLYIAKKLLGITIPRTIIGTMDLSSGTGSLYLSQLTLGVDFGGFQGGTGGSNTGNLIFGSGSTNVLDVSGSGNPVRLGYTNYSTADNGVVAGTLTINNLAPTSVVEATDASTAILLGTKVAFTSSASGALNFNGGTLTIKTAGGAAIAGGGGGGSSNLSLSGTGNVGATLKAGSSSSDWINNLSTATLGTAGGGSTFDTNGYTIGMSQGFSGSGGLRKSGGGTLTLFGSNSYTGTTSINAGMLQIGSSGTVGQLATTSVITGSAGGTLAFNRSDTITAGTQFNSVIGGAINVAQFGSGTLVLNGANTYTGTTAVYNGTLQVGAGATSGTISSSSVLALGGGRLALNRSGAFTQAFASTSLDPGASSVSANETNAANFGSITRNAGATLDITTTGTFITSTANTNDILGGGITFGGTTWAVANGASPITGLASASYQTTSTVGTTAASYADQNIDVISSEGVLSDVITPNSLRFDSAAANTVTLAAGGLSAVRNGILITANVGSNASVITGGTLAGSFGGDLVVIANNASSSSTLASVIADNTTATGLTKSGGGTLVLSGANEYTGITWVNGGSLVAANAAAFGAASGSIVVEGGVLDLGGLNITRTGAVTLQRGTIRSGTLTNNTVAFDAQSGTAAAVLAGSAGLTKTTVGTVVLSGSNTYSGPTAIYQGTLQIGDNGTTGALATSSTITGYAGGVLAFNRTNRIVQGSEFASVIGGGLTVTQVGSGTVALTGVNTYTGRTNINAGTLQIGNSGTAGSIANSSVITGLAGATLAFNRTDVVTQGTDFNVIGRIEGAVNVAQLGSGTLVLNSVNNTYTGTTSILAGTLQAAGSSNPLGSGTISFGGGALQYGGGNTTDYSSRFVTAGQDRIIDTAGQSVTYATALQQTSGTGSLTKLGAGTLILTASSSYTGATSINSGILQIGSSGATGALSPSSSITGSAGALLRFARTNTITQGAEFGSVIGGGINLTLNAAGTVVLNGSNTYSGTTTINTGTLSINSIANVGGDSSALGSPSTAASGTIAMGATAAAGLVYTGAGHTTNRVINLAGTTFGVTLDQSGSNVLKFTSNFTATGAGIKTLTLRGSTSGTGEIAGAIVNSTTFTHVTKAGSGTWILSGSSTYTGTTSINAGTLQIGNNGTTGALATASAITGSAGATLAFNRTNAVTQGTHFNTVIGGSINVTQLGSGTLALSGVNTYSGTTSLAAGTLQVSNASALGSGTISFDGGTLRYSGITTDFSNRFRSASGQSYRVDTNGQNVAFATALASSNGTLTKLGSGTLTLSASNGYAGTTTVNTGVLALSGNGALATTGTVDVAASGAAFDISGISASGLTIGSLSGSAGSVVTLGGKTLTFGDATATTFAGGIGGTGGITKQGAGAATITGSNVYTGATNVLAGGALVLGNAGWINSTSGISVAAGGRFAVNSSAPLTIAPVLAGVDASSRAILGGLGTIDAAVTLDSLGDVLSPGNSPGILTFGTSQSWASYTYDWEINDFTGLTAGTAFDQIAITGGLDLTGGASSYVLNILSLTSGNLPGDVPNFDDSGRSWVIMSTTGGITGFDASKWTINTSGFTATPAPTGSWSVSKVGNDVVLDFIVVPEPGALVLAGLGVAVAAWGLRRRR